MSMVTTESLPLAEIKAHVSEIVDRVEHEHHRIVLTRNGRAAAVILSAADLEALEDTLTGAALESARDVRHPLRRELVGLWSARRGAYRVIYQIDEVEHVVSVVRVDHRADICRSR